MTIDKADVLVGSGCLLTVGGVAAFSYGVAAVVAGAMLITLGIMGARRWV